MRAVLCRTWGDEANLVVAETECPRLSEGKVRVEVYAVGVNFADSLLISGSYQHKPSLPFIPGFELSGRVTELAPGLEVSGLRIGDRVLGVLTHGAFAEEVVLSASDVFRVPDSMDYVTAAALPIAYGTSIGALEWRASLQQGERLLVLGAGGGVGLAAVELGKAAGATVLAAAGSKEKLAVARQRGADHLIDYARQDMRSVVKTLTDGQGVDVIIDPVGGAAFDAALRCVAWEGRIVVIGFAGGTIPQVPANIVLVKNCAILGFYWDSYRTRAPARLRASFEKLMRQYEAGLLRPEISMQLDLSEAGRAIALLRSRTVAGKIVLTTGRQ